MPSTRSTPIPATMRRNARSAFPALGLVLCALAASIALLTVIPAQARGHRAPGTVHGMTAAPAQA